MNESLLKVSTEKAPAAIGPYSQAVVAGGVLYTSGQIPVNPETNAIAGNTIEEQAEQVMKNLGAVLAEAGTTFEKVVKTTCFIADMGILLNLMRFTQNILPRNQQEAVWQ